MRCIEIPKEQELLAVSFRLIETWDVLKCCTRIFSGAAPVGLIETWDVLKFFPPPFLSASESGLIETWDVLKLYLLRYIVNGF